MDSFKSIPFDGLLKAGLDTPSPAIMDAWFNRFHCGDTLDLMERMPAQSVDLIVTSPPYSLKQSSGNGMKSGNGGKWPKASSMNGYEAHDDCMPHGDYVAWQRDCLAAMMRLIKPAGAIFYNRKWRVQRGLLQDRADILDGFPVRQIIIWRRKGGINFNPGYFLPTYEVIYPIAKPDFRLAPKANAAGDVWDIPQESSNPHPAPFPVELARRRIGSTDAKAILDPSMGSGTTAIAAEAEERQWIGIEESKGYCRLAKERMAVYRKQR